MSRLKSQFFADILQIEVFVNLKLSITRANIFINTFHAHQHIYVNYLKVPLILLTKNRHFDDRKIQRIPLLNKHLVVIMMSLCKFRYFLTSNQQSHNKKGHLQVKTLKQIIFDDPNITQISSIAEIKILIHIFRLC